MILGTAGHIDHGKTTLVRALTGVDTDRLPEEKRRGITVDLGFAPLRCDDGRTIGVVDVPGHEAFVRTMLAGATGIDLALLVIAADEGVMPQTREHLAILTLLGVRGGIVALTKCDTVDDEWLQLVTEEVRGAVASSPLAGSPILPASGTTGEGIDALRDAICRAAASLPLRDPADLFRLPVDRSFTIRGTGTVVTGTVWSGTVRQDAVVRILPGNRTARVRGIQVHGDHRREAAPGTRAAISLHGVNVDQVSRGSVLVTDPAWRETRMLRAEVALLDDRPLALGPRSRVRFHLATHDVGARIVASGGALVQGVVRGVRVVLDAPVVARAGDRFVLRGTAPLATIGGGVITDPMPAGRRLRPWNLLGPSAQARFARVLEEEGLSGIDPHLLPVRLGLTPADARQLLHDASAITVPAGDRVYPAALVPPLVRRAVAAVAAHHRDHPLEPGASVQSVRSGLAVAPELGDAVIRLAVDEGQLEQAGATIALHGWRPTPTPGQARLADQLRETLTAAGLEPPSVSELGAAHGAEVGPVLRLLEREGYVVPVEEGRYFARAAVMKLESTLLSELRPGQVYSPAELRDLLGVSRKYLIPLLEYSDRLGLTDRRGGGRVLRGT